MYITVVILAIVMMIVFKYLVYFFVLLSGEGSGSLPRDEYENLEKVKMEARL